MKVIYWVIGIVIGIPTLLLIVMYGASEMGGEVVTLERPEQNGETSSVRIWIVDDGGASWIEHGDADSFWINQLAESPRVVLSRGGQTTSFVGIADRNSHDLYHKLRREKYSWADQVVELFSGSAKECQGTPVRLQSAN
jgi:hypothetical protein